MIDKLNDPTKYFPPSVEGGRLEVRFDRGKLLSDIRYYQRISEPSGGGCLGLIFGLVEFMGDPSGDKRKKEALDKENTLADKYYSEEKVGKIIAKLEYLNKDAETFTSSLPEDSEARRLVDHYGAACLCQISQLPDGRSIALLRGEEKDSGSHRTPESQKGAIMTSEGRIYRTYLVGSRGMSPGTIRRQFMGQNNEFGEPASTEDRREFLQKVQDAINKPNPYTKICIVRGKETTLTLAPVDTSIKNHDVDRVNDFFRNSQRRAIIVAAEMTP